MTTPDIIRTAALDAAPAAPEDGPAPRVLTGRALTWGETAYGTYRGRPIAMRADRGAVSADLSRNVVVLRDHDSSRLIGRVEALDDREDGLYATLRIASTPEGEEALTLAREGVLTGMSLGTRAIDVEELPDGTLISRSEELYEISLTPFPAQDSARLEATRKENPMPEPTTEPNPAVPPQQPGPETQRNNPQVPPPAIVPAAPQSAPVLTTRSTLASPGEYLSAYARAQINRADSADYDRIMRAVADQVTGDVPGIMPTPILGPVIDLRYDQRPLWNSLTPRGLPPAGKTFTRPRITQHTNVDTQAAEKDELVSRAMKITGDPVSISTIAGTLDVSFQVIDFTEPALMNILVQDFVDTYIVTTEQKLATQFATDANTNTGFTADPADSAAVIAAFYQAAAAVFTAAGRFPDTVWASVDSWATLGSLVDADKRPLFPTLAPTNAAGGTMNITTPTGSPLGARLVVSPALPAKTIIVGSSAMYETYERIRGMIQALNVTQWGMDIAYGGYSAWYTPAKAAFQPVKLVAAGPAAATVK